MTSDLDERAAEYARTWDTLVELARLGDDGPDRAEGLEAMIGLMTEVIEERGKKKPAPLKADAKREERLGDAKVRAAFRKGEALKAALV